MEEIGAGHSLRSGACPIRAQPPPNTRSCRRSPRPWRHCPTIRSRRWPTSTSRWRCADTTATRSTPTCSGPASSWPSCRPPGRRRRPSAARSSGWERRSRGSSSARTRPAADHRPVAQRGRGAARGGPSGGGRRSSTRAEERVRELDAETDRIWAERHRIVEDTRELARELLTLTDSAADRFPADPAAAEDGAVPSRSTPARCAARRGRRADPAPVEVRGRGRADRRGADPRGRRRTPSRDPHAEPDPHVEPSRDPAGRRAARGRPPSREVAVAARSMDERAADRRHAPRPPARDRRWLVGDVLIDPGPSSCLDDAARARSATSARARCCSRTSTSTMPARAGRWSRAGPTSRCTCTSAERGTWSAPSGCSTAPGSSTGRTWIACGARSSRSPRRTCACCSGGETLFDGEFEVAYTPGHASHHVSYLHDGTAFVGDVGGVRIAGAPFDHPAQPAARHRRRDVARARSSGSPPGGPSGWR